MLKFKTSCAVLAYLSSNLLNEVGLFLFRYFEVGLRVCDIVVKNSRSLSHLLMSSYLTPKLINLPISLVSCSPFTLGNPRQSDTNNTTNTHLLFALSLQDNASVHCARDTVELLRHETPQFISPDMWPADSPELNPVDYRTWGMTQDRGY